MYSFLEAKEGKCPIPPPVSCLGREDETNLKLVSKFESRFRLNIAIFKPARLEQDRETEILRSAAWGLSVVG